MQVKQIIKISLIVALFLASYFLEGYEVKDKMLPLMAIYVVFLNHFDIFDVFKSDKNHLIYLLRGLNFTFLFLAIWQLFFLAFSFKVMLVIFFSAALLSIFLNAKLSLDK